MGKVDSATPLYFMSFFKKPNLEIAALLIDHGAKISLRDTWAHFLPAKWILDYRQNKLAELFLFYALIQEDIANIKELTKLYPLTKAILNEWIKKRPISRSEFNQADQALRKLLGEKIITQELFDEFRKILQNGINASLDINSYPQCLQAFIKKESLPDVPLKNLLAELQYHRKKLPSPLPEDVNVNKWTDAEDQKNFNFIKDNAQLLELSSLDEFINPINMQKSAVELHLNEGIVLVLCRIAVHKEISKEQKNKIITLLDRYENPSESEKIIIGMSKTILDYSESIGKGIEDLSSVIATSQEQISSEVNTLKSEIVSLQKTNQENLKHIVILSEDNHIIKKQLADTTAILGEILKELKSLKSEKNTQNNSNQPTASGSVNFWK